VLIYLKILIKIKFSVQICKQGVYIGGIGVLLQVLSR
jgi:hypothetical protein